MKLFEEFIKNGTVKKQAMQVSRARDLIEESKRKEESLKERLEKIGLKNDNANDVIEDCYAVLMCLIRAKLLLDGYISSGYSAHEAEVSYMKNLGFSENEVEFMDRLRYFRNGILYYGKRFDAEYAEKVIVFANKITLKLKKIIGTGEKKC